MSAAKSRFGILLPIILPIVLGAPACGRSESVATAPPAAPAPGGFVPDTKPVPPVLWLDATVPAGTVIKLGLIDSLDSGSSHKGDPFRALMTEAILIEGSVFVPSGSNLLGVVGEAVPASADAQGKGRLLLDFQRIETPTGASATLKARLSALAPSRTGAVLASGRGQESVLSGTKGKNAVLEPGTGLTVTLVEPLRIKVKQ